MKFFSRKRRKNGGYIGYFGLEEWWLKSFSETERDYICAKYKPLGASENPLTVGNITNTTQSVLGFLSNLASWFGRVDDRPIAHKIMEKAEQYAGAAEILDRHFFCQTRIEIYYKDRDKSGFLDKAILACREQIEMAPKAAIAFEKEYGGSPLPAHVG